MLTVLELALWLIVYGFLCGAASGILGKAKVHPLSWLVLLPFEVGRLFVTTRGWQHDAVKPDKGPTTLMEEDG